ncbi:MAG: trimethylamine methyltransferase family protein [Deltaproteobacteria bacterium]|nr:trimethylamine methyltransferase family protein [Deltaproteobacteria bacterium]MBW2070054.1 trimethylamine methyltransferase family protein [Deltaproteobacteria bacterium]
MKRTLHAGKTQSVGFGFRIFSDDELYDIHLATLEVLQHTGVFVENEEALEILDGGGAVIDNKKKIAKLPPYLVEDSLRSAPPKFIMAGRRPEDDFVVESNRVGFTNFSEGILIADLETGELREPTKKDVADSAKLGDFLSEVSVYNRAVGAHDVPAEVAPVHNAEAFFNNTTKHCMIGPFSGYQLRQIVKMASAVVGGEDRLRQRPLVSFHTCPVSPLRLVNDTCEILMESARCGMMVNVISMAMAGASSSIHLAGTLVDHNAELLASVTLNQLTCKGAPIMYGSSTTAMDLRFAAATVGSPECAMINAGVAELARYNGLPSFVAGG